MTRQSLIHVLTNQLPIEPTAYFKQKNQHITHETHPILWITYD